jgi:hypothetical protein
MKNKKSIKRRKKNAPLCNYGDNFEQCPKWQKYVNGCADCLLYYKNE